MGALRPSRGASLLVRGARAWPAERTLDLRIVAGRVEELGSGLEPRGETLLEAEGLALIPGLVDVHVHFRDPGLAHKEGWEHGSLGALHGGVTSVVEVQNNPPFSITREALLARIEHVRARSRVDFGCLANLLPASLPELGAMAPLTPAFKLFMGGSTGLSGQGDRDTLARLFEGAARAGRMIVTHCEDEALLAAGRQRYPRASAAEHHLVRSSEAEVESIRTAIALARQSGARLHVFHVSTGEGARLIAEARRAGLPVGASTAPHYLLLDCEAVARIGNFAKVNPSIKTAEDARVLLEHLASGDIEAIGTDHAPHTLEEKQRPYAEAPSGMPSVDLLWPLTLELVHRGLADAGTALASVSSRAADSLSLPGKGRLEPGWDGDLVLFDPKERRRVVGTELPSRSKWSAYEGWELGGFPRVVVRRGAVVFRDGRARVEAGGMALELEPARPRA